MNGTELDEQLNMIRQFEELEYTDIQAYCQVAFINKKMLSLVSIGIMKSQI